MTSVSAKTGIESARLHLCLRTTAAALALATAGSAAAGPLDDLAPLHWYEAPNTKMEAVYPPQPWPSGHPQYVISAWGGGAYDTNRDRMVIFGGGHADYAGNEIYAFSVEQMTWSRVTDPSCIDNCPKNVGYYPDGRPSSSHTYNSLEYIPTIDRFVQATSAAVWGDGNFGTRNTNLFDFETGSWSRGADVPTTGNSIGQLVAYDSGTGHLWTQSAMSGTTLAKYDPFTNNWTVVAETNDYLKIYATPAIDPERRLMVAVGGYGDTPQLIAWDLDNPTEMMTPTTSGDTEIELSEAPGFSFDPVTKNFVAWDGGSSVYTLNPDTWTWTKVSAASTNDVSPGPANNTGTYGRFRYVPSKNVFILVNDESQNVYFFKLTEQSGMPLSPPSPPESITVSSVN